MRTFSWPLPTRLWRPSPRRWVLFAALVTSCGLANQALNSPCVGKPATAAGGQCPPCQTDADCKVLANKCEPFAYCVAKDSNWQVSTTTCTAAEEHPPTTDSCRCLANICDWHY